ncbi:hypothetical protein PAECIP111893_01326 [Paenibacillus plantiphilus]|uniref:Uncharacterized protein n=1 Tax=Paenibacillus plantiphilus TaxID=2905650 RepID=A0ABN8GAW1_9BACL|nr:hypothetical protein [Paenibacillus plantiphilus]CAH1199349.1 hypothetical protein PAECIP111893_01326 [Paenibacillus plantiphilus]
MLIAKLAPFFRSVSRNFILTEIVGGLGGSLLSERWYMLAADVVSVNLSQLLVGFQDEVGATVEAASIPSFGDVRLLLSDEEADPLAANLRTGQP